MYKGGREEERRGVDSSAMFDESSSPASLERPPRMSRMQIESVEYYSPLVYTRVG
jgi:hypothetical protein